uniref:Uncharacterized protein n=1 Tax=Uncultured archaeon GZfos26G2 TaxID=3386331 RepID=Q648G8_UNCAG|nr:hypothetical protein GZ37D1_56 [uncultured archaeon GZfos37D1]
MPGNCRDNDIRGYSANTRRKRHRFNSSSRHISRIRWITSREIYHAAEERVIKLEIVRPAHGEKEKGGRRSPPYPIILF